MQETKHNKHLLKDKKFWDLFYPHTVHQLSPQTIDAKTVEKKLASQEETLVPLDLSRLYLSENPDNHHQKRTVQPGDAFEDTAFKPGGWNCQILHQVVEFVLFTYL
jgi:hypothetical protein